MTLDEARGSIGAEVHYHDDWYGGCGPTDGVITSAGDRYVFVRYGSEQHSKATDPAALTFLARKPVSP